MTITIPPMSPFPGRGAAPEDYIAQADTTMQQLPGVIAKMNEMGAAFNLGSAVLSAGYLPPVPYAAGISMTVALQTVQRGEVTYAPLIERLPFVTGAEFDATAWRVVQGVTIARLATSDASSLIGHGVGTVGEALDAATLGVSENSQELVSQGSKLRRVLDAATGRDITPMMVDLHFGTLCGAGWLGNAVEVGGVEPVPTTATMAKPPLATSIEVADVSIFRAGQLICYAAPSGNWYSAKIFSLAGAVLTLDREMPEGISVGGQVIYFYANDAHPNKWGYTCIADDALRQLAGKGALAYSGKNYEIWSPIGAATVTGITLGAVGVAGYLIPGTSTNGTRAARVDMVDIGQGASSDFVALNGGAYRALLVLNVGARTGGLSNSVRIDVLELRADGVEYTISTRTAGGNVGLRSIAIDYAITIGSAVRLKVTSLVAGASSLTIGQLRHVRQGDAIASLDHGTHVMFGDSWFASGYLMARLQARLPNATFINRGVAGNRASDLLARFASDVGQVAQAFTWFISGTNDYYADVPAPLFEQQVAQIASLVAGIGSQLIAFNASVGDATYAPAPGERLSASRGYANNVNYLAATAVPDGLGARQRSASISVCGVQIPANSTVVVAAIPGRTVLPAALRYLYSSGTGLQVHVGYAGIIDDATLLIDAVTVAGGDTLKSAMLPRSENQLRFVVVTITNPSGAPSTTSLVADITWRE